MMVLCFLMSIPLKMMAEIVTIHFVDKESTKWESYAAYVYDTTKPDDGSNRVTGEWPGQKVTNSADIETLANGYKVVTWTIDLKTFALSNLVVVFNNQNNGKQYPASGQPGMEVKNGYYYYSDGTMSDTAPSGTETGGGTEGGGSTGPTEKWDTEKTNRLTEKPRVYSQGFYLAGNFFTFDEKDKINYDDAVFKFQEQKDQDISIAEDARTVYDIYKVEIPASLTAHAQVMYVDEFGKTKNIFGPGKYSISRTCPETDKSKGWLEAKPYVCDPTTNKEIDNCWNFVSRNETENEYSDGMYNLYIAVDSKAHTVVKWKIEHDSDRRVAYFISDAPDASAMPIYDAYNNGVKYFSNRFYGSVSFAENRSYYVISNIVRGNEDAIVNRTKENYGTVVPTSDQTNPKSKYNPTTNKLFLMGNGGLDFADKNPNNSACPNEKPIKFSADWSGNQIVEYNPNKGYWDRANTDEHLGFAGEVYFPGGKRIKITSVSMVGDAIPGTLKVDETTGKEVWDFTSKAADMTYDDVEQCYATTIVTTVGDGKKHFRFVGNHDPNINWFEDTDGTELDKMAKTPYKSTDPNVHGHTADANDPNQVNYTQEGAYSGDNYHILWNRPAGRWTVRLYFYTRNVDGQPVTDYYYTITANRDMELHDLVDVVYGSETNKQNITNLGGYRYMRTWSAQKSWKISDKVDIFVVSSITDDKSGVVKMTLKNINGYVSGGDDHVIPANTGVILATTSDAASQIPGAKFKSREDFTSYNNLVIPMEQYDTDVTYDGSNFLKPILLSRVIPSSDKDNYNYLFGYYNAQIATGDKINYGADKYLLGFWISKGSKPYLSNSSYLPIDKETAAKMNRLGTSYDDFGPAVGSAKKVPGVIFDFDNVGGTTGINEVVNQSTQLNDDKYYTLSGQQVEKPTAGGIYIHNGRKFVVK